MMEVSRPPEYARTTFLALPQNLPLAAAWADTVRARWARAGSTAAVRPGTDVPRNALF
jgi:hypothetical protein